MRFHNILLLFLCLLSFPALTQEEKTQAQVLYSEIRCLECAGQTIADSSSPFAETLREEIKVRLQKGESPEEIKDFLVNRYGQEILLSPPLSSNTWLLWFSPLLLLGLGILLLLTRIYKGSSHR